jgi:hypothetical protein
MPCIVRGIVKAGSLHCPPFHFFSSIGIFLYY